MSGLNFRPLTSQLGIGGTSYILQLGLINSKWAAQLLKKKGLIASKVFKDLDENDIPDVNHIVNWIIKTIPMSINSYQIWKTVQILLKQAKKNKERKKELITIEGAKEVKLDKIPISEPIEPVHEKVKERLEENYSCSVCGLTIKYCPKCGSVIKIE